MAKNNPISFRISKPEVLEALDSIGETLDRDRSYMINEAMETYIELNDWQVAQIKAGLKEADEGKFAKPSDIDKMLGRKRKK